MAWWLNPSRFVLFITLPAFAVSAMLASDSMDMYGAANYIDSEDLLVGCAMLLLLALGSWLGKMLVPQAEFFEAIDPRRAVAVASMLVLISSLSHIVLIGGILLQPQLILEALAGSQGAIYAVKAEMNKVVGLTSFTQLYLIALPLCASLRYIYRIPLSPGLVRLIKVLVVLVVMRAFLTLERFAIIEAGVAMLLPIALISVRTAALQSMMPLVGGIFVFVLFSAGEYTRSWPYYESSYDSFLEFSVVRFLGYISTATNNAAAVLATSEAMGMPYFTGAWIRRLPIWDWFDSPFPDRDPLKDFFAESGNAEFNNPSGVLAGVMDYGVAGGLLFYLIVGLLLGYLFGLFRSGRVGGLLLYPGFFVGLLTLTQAIYWADSRFTLFALVAPLVVNWIRAIEPPAGQQYVVK